MQRPMSLNSYSWVEGNVLNRADPTGQCSFPGSLFLNIPQTTPHPFPAQQCRQNCWAAPEEGPNSAYDVDYWETRTVNAINLERCLRDCPEFTYERNNSVLGSSVVIRFGNWDDDCPNPSKCCRNSLEACSTNASENGRLGTIAFAPNGSSIGIWTHSHFAQTYDPSVNLQNILGRGDWIQFRGRNGTLTVPMFSESEDNTLVSDMTFSTVNGLFLTSPEISVSIADIGVVVPSGIAGVNISRNEHLIVAYIPGQNPTDPVWDNIELSLTRIVESPGYVNVFSSSPVDWYLLDSSFTNAGDSGGGVFRVSDSDRISLIGTIYGRVYNDNPFSGNTFLRWRTAFTPIPF